MKKPPVWNLSVEDILRAQRVTHRSELEKWYLSIFTMRSIVVNVSCIFLGISLWVSPSEGAEPSARSAPSPNWTNIYRHESGACLRYPDRWQIKLDSNLGAVLLLPDDGGKGSRETIMVSSADGQGVSNPSEPIVRQGIESLVLRFFPLARRNGKPETITSGSKPAVQSTWDSADVVGGNQTRIRVYTTLLGRNVVSLTMIAPKEQIAARESVLRQIFDTFDLAPPGAVEAVQTADSAGVTSGLDGRLVGTWVKMEYKQVLSSSVVKYTYATLRPDGSAQFQMGGESFHPGVAGQSSSSASSHWRTSGTRLVITSDGGADEYNYEIVYNNGTPALRLHPINGGKMQEWDKSKNRSTQ